MSDSTCTKQACVAVLNAAGKLVVESVVETGAATVLGFLKGLRGQVEVTFEEGTHAAWLYVTLQRAKVKVVVCDPRRNRLLQDGNKSDRVDARKLAQLLRAGLLSPVYHGGTARATSRNWSGATSTWSRTRPAR